MTLEFMTAVLVICASVKSLAEGVDDFPEWLRNHFAVVGILALGYLADNVFDSDIMHEIALCLVLAGAGGALTEEDKVTANKIL